jgi:hypothetical protein
MPEIPHQLHRSDSQRRETPIPLSNSTLAEYGYVNLKNARDSVLNAIMKIPIVPVDKLLDSFFPLVSGHIVDSVIGYLRTRGKFSDDCFSHFKVLPANSSDKESVTFKPLETLYADIMSSPSARSQSLPNESVLVVAGDTTVSSARINTSKPDGYILHNRLDPKVTAPLWSNVVVPIKFNKSNSESFRQDVGCCPNSGLIY